MQHKKLSKFVDNFWRYLQKCETCFQWLNYSFFCPQSIMGYCWKTKFISSILIENTLHTFGRNSKSYQRIFIIFGAAWSCEAPLENWQHYTKYLSPRFLAPSMRSLLLPPGPCISFWAGLGAGDTMKYQNLKIRNHSPWFMSEILSKSVFSVKMVQFGSLQKMQASCNQTSSQNLFLSCLLRQK